jgi:hypothetical protein
MTKLFMESYNTKEFFCSYLEDAFTGTSRSCQEPCDACEQAGKWCRYCCKDARREDQADEKDDEDVYGGVVEEGEMVEQARRMEEIEAAGFEEASDQQEEDVDSMIIGQ